MTMRFPMPSSSAARRGLAAAALLTLAACSQAPSRLIAGDSLAGRTTEKAVMRALSAVEASEQQRREVLSAFDRDDAERRRIRDESETLRRQIARLPKSEADYVERLEPLAQRQGQILTTELLIQARFDKAVAELLTPEQLADWEPYLRASLRRDYYPGEDGARRRPGVAP